MRSMRKEDGSRFSSIYLRTINNQLDAILNHVANFYQLERNPHEGTSQDRKEEGQGDERIFMSGVLAL